MQIAGLKVKQESKLDSEKFQVADRIVLLKYYFLHKMSSFRQFTKNTK